MSRAGGILQLYEVSLGTVAGVTRGAITAARFKQKMDDKVRQAGLGDKLDKARAERRKALKRRLSNPLSKKRRQEHIKASDRVADVKDLGHQKLKKMLHKTSGTIQSEITQ